MQSTQRIQLGWWRYIMVMTIQQDWSSKNMSSMASMNSMAKLCMMMSVNWTCRGAFEKKHVE